MQVVPEQEGAPQDERAVERALLWSVWAPLTLGGLALRTIRVVKRGDVAGVLGAVDLYRSDLCVYLGILLLCVGSLRALRAHIRLQRVVFVMMQCGALLWASLELAGQNFFLVSGSTLDFLLVQYALSPENDTWTLVRESTPAIFFVLGALGALWFILAPWLAQAWLARRPHRPLVWSRWGWVAALALLLLALVPPLREPSKTFAANTVLHVALTGLEVLREEDASGQSFSTLEARLIPTAKKPKNIVVIVLESTRASATTLHNPELSTTPYLFELAKQSIWAKRAYAVVPHTSKALVSILCGVEPNLTLPITESSTQSLPAKCMAKLLGEQGYHTAFFQTATASFERREQLVKNMGYQYFVAGEGLPSTGFERSNYFGVEDDAMLLPTKAWIESHRDKPFYLTYLTVTPHHEYLAPKRYGRKSFSTQVMFNRYLNSVHYVDHFVKNVVEQLKSIGVWEETILVVVGDHGEGFGEHKLKQHDNIMYNEGLWVPLLIHDAGSPAPQQIENIVSQIDIAPTVLSMAGWSVQGALRGQDMRQVGAARRHFGYCWYDRSCVAMIEGQHKFIHHFGKRPDEVFDLLADPQEQHNIASSYPELSDKVAAMMRWRNVVKTAYDNYYKNNLHGFVSDEQPTDIQNKNSFDMGDYLEFLGFSVPESGGIDSSYQGEITFFYRVKRTIPAGWALTIQALTEQGKWMSLDHSPVEGLYPLDMWRRGQYVRDTYKFRVPEHLRQGGRLKIYLGMFRVMRDKSIERASVSGQPADGKSRVHIGTLNIPVKKQGATRDPKSPGKADGVKIP